MGKSTDLKTGWLSPNGDFYECRVYEHFSLAREILKDSCVKNPDTELLELGFAEISISQLGMKTWYIFWLRYLTDQQKNFLKPYFEDETLPVGVGTKMRWEIEDECRVKKL